MSSPVRVSQLWIPGRLPGLNDIVAMNRSSHHAYHACKNKWHHTIGLIAMASGAKRFERAHIRLQWVEPNKRRDPDNVCGGLKFILDALKLSGVLGSDGWAGVLSIAHTWGVDKSNPGVRVTLIAG